MSSGLDAYQEEEQDDYERKNGKFNRKCEELLDKLSEEPVAHLSVSDLQFLFWPHGTYKYASSHWTQDKLDRLWAIKQKIKPGGE